MIRLKNIGNLVLALAVVAGMGIQIASPVWAGVPTEPPETPDLRLNIQGEAYQQLPGADTDSSSSEWFRQAFADIIGSLLTVVMTVAAVLLLLYLIWGALSWITSAGDKGKLEEARNRITTAIIGMVVLASTIALFMFVQQFLGICVLDFWGNECTAPPT